MTGSAAGDYPRALLLQASSALMGVAATIGRLSNSTGPSMELLEARRAVHNALVALGGWSDPHGDEAESERVLTSP